MCISYLPTLALPKSGSGSRRCILLSARFARELPFAFCRQLYMHKNNCAREKQKILKNFGKIKKTCRILQMIRYEKVPLSGRKQIGQGHFFICFCMITVFSGAEYRDTDRHRRDRRGDSQAFRSRRSDVHYPGRIQGADTLFLRVRIAPGSAEGGHQIHDVLRVVKVHGR